MDPKFLHIPVLESDYLYAFHQSSLERSYKYRIHMKPPPLTDDLIDPLGNEEWAKAIVFDPKDQNLLRKEGDVPKKGNPRRQQESKPKSWMLKTIYTTNNQYNPKATTPKPVEEEEEEEEKEDLRLKQVGRIERQFQFAKQLQEAQTIEGSEKKVKRILPFVPNRALRELNLHLTRFKVGEVTNIVADKSAIMVRRKENLFSPENPYSPLSLFVGNEKKKKVEDEDDLFADEDEAEEQEDEIRHIRDYAIDIAGLKRRFVFSLDQDKAQFAELCDDGFKCFRTVKRQRSSQDDDEDQDENKEDHVKLTIRTELSEDEKQERKQRLEDIERV
jgi:hypothetical protein